MKLLKTAAAAAALAGPAAAQEAPSPRAPQTMRDITPGLAGYTDNILFGEVWRRPGLTPRDRSLVTLSSLVAGGRSAQMTSHVRVGLGNGLKPGEISEILTHLAFYSGWPNAVSALNVTHEVFKAEGVDLATLAAAPGPPLPISDSDASRAATVRETVAPTVPALADYTNRILFDDLWSRPHLSPRDRSLVTIAALVTTGDLPQLEFHLRLGLQNGLTRGELSEAVNHLAFYAGWPKAMAAVPMLKAAFAEPATVPALTYISAGASPSTGSASNFTGSVHVDTGFQGVGPMRVGGARVTFQAGARTNWHKHALGQTLIVTAGRGFVQEENASIRPIATGDVVIIAPDVKHWHGAAPDSAMTHFAVSERGDQPVVTWLEPVTDAQYRGH
ncbi:MAG: carboxymuconolactone decarboxylase family protein [Pseudomonadota bacterium]